MQSPNSRSLAYWSLLVVIATVVAFLFWLVLFLLGIELSFRESLVAAILGALVGALVQANPRKQQETLPSERHKQVVVVDAQSLAYWIADHVLLVALTSSLFWNGFTMLALAHYIPTAFAIYAGKFAGKHIEEAWHSYEENARI